MQTTTSNYNQNDVDVYIEHTTMMRTMITMRIDFTVLHIHGIVLGVSSVFSSVAAFPFSLMYYY